MEIFIVVLIIIIISVIVLNLFRTQKAKQVKIINNEVSLSSDYTDNYFPDIQIIESNTLIPSEKNKIVNEDIKKAVSIVDNYASNGTMMTRNIKNASELLNNDRAFFSSAKKGTEKMLKVKGTNEVYGAQMQGNKFNKQTKFLREDDLIKAQGKDALVNAGFNVAAMVVGQYYMSEINDKLDTIQQNIQGISEFLDTEYQGKLSQIISKMKEILDNKVEILENNYSRDKRYDEILGLESECAKLLGQANEMIKNYIVNEDYDYKKYEKNMKEMQVWCIRQQLLQRLLLEIGNLRYVLANGNETSILSHTQYNNYLMQTNSINEELEKWHTMYCEKFGINKEEHKRKANFFELRKNTIGRINNEWAYSKMDKDIENMIDTQINMKRLKPYIKNRQNEKIQIQKYNGEYYNLPSNN